MTPKVSIIIPAYKAEHLLEALASVFAQSNRDYEVLVVNDGSPHGIGKLLQPFAEKGQINYIEQDNSGTAAARNRGLREARGEFIAFLDDDDYWPEDKLEWQAGYLDGHPEVGMIVGDAALVDETGKVRAGEPVPEGPVTLEGMFKGCNITSPGQTLIRRTLMDGGRAFDERFSGADDVDLWLTLAAKTQIMIIPRLALYYRWHQGNASRDNLSMCLKTQRVLQKHLALASLGSREGLRRSAATWLYQLRGVALIREWKRMLVRGEWRDSSRYISAIAWFVRSAVSDPRLLAAVCREILPARFFAK